LWKLAPFDFRTGIADRNDCEEKIADGIGESVLADPTVYNSVIRFQFKYQLYHIGVLTTGGTDDKDAVLSDTWRLEQRFAVGQ
jgi:hypothetical protein